MNECAALNVYCTVAQLADVCRCEPGVIYRLIRQGKLRAFKLGVGYRISPAAAAECEALLSAESAERIKRRKRKNDADSEE